MDRNIKVFLVFSHHPGQARKSLWIETEHVPYILPIALGQARKSLWIETARLADGYLSGRGQARKSLWIETRY